MKFSAETALSEKRVLFSAFENYYRDHGQN
jgi:hypothetical protein